MRTMSPVGRPLPHRRRRVVLIALAMLAGSILTLPQPALAAGEIFVFTGNGALDEGYTQFAGAAGKPLLTAAILPADLSAAPCVILPVNASSFTASQKTVFSEYLAGGGTLIALAEHSGFPGSISTMNNLATTLGSGMSVIPDVIDSGFHTTTSIDSHILTGGMSSYVYAATSRVAIGGQARSLIRTQTGNVTFIGTEPIGLGTFVLAGDSNGFSDNSGSAYTGAYGNGRFAENLCGVGGGGAIRVPVIFAHGIMGAYLKNRNGELFPAAGTTARDISDDHYNPLRLAADGVNPLRNEPDYQVSVMTERGIGGILGVVTACIIKCFSGDAYQTTFDLIEAAGYRIGRTLFPFAYDFRKSAQGNGALLLQKIDQVRALTGAPRINVIAHSQGGLVTRAMLSLPGSFGKVNRVVTVGTPYLGATQAIGVLDYQKPCKAKEIAGKCFLNRSKVQELATNWPGFLELIPPRNFYTPYLSPIYSFIDDDGDGSADGFLSHAEVRATLADRNLALIDQAQGFHDRHDFYRPFDPSVQLLRVIGSGLPSITRILLYEEEECHGILWWRDCSMERKSEFNYASGDETVPLHSADLYDPKRNFDLRGGAFNKYVSKVAHGELVRSQTVINFILAYLADTASAAPAAQQAGAAAAGPSTTGPSTTGTTGPSDQPLSVAAAGDIGDTPTALSGVEVVVKGAATGAVSDPAGKLVGIEEPTLGIETFDVPGASYNGGDRYGSYFFTGTDAYTGRWTAAEAGEVGITVRRFVDDGIIGAASSPRMTLQQGAVVTLGFTGTPDLATLRLDVDDDADGDVDRQVAFRPPVTVDDRTPPVSAVSVEKFTDPDGRRMARVTVSATDDATAVERIEYAIDATGQTGVYSQPILLEGKGELIVRAIDGAGNVEAPYKVVTLDDFPGRREMVRTFVKPQPAAAVEGFMDYAADVDWIGLEVDEGYSAITLIPPAKDYDAALYDTDGNLIWNGNARGLMPEALTVRLDAGRYFLRITGASGQFDEQLSYRILAVRAGL